MAETRRVPSARPSPPRRRPGAGPIPPIPARPAEAPPRLAPRSSRPAPAPPRTGAERLVLAVLVLGLTLNAVALLRHAGLSRADLLLGATVLLAGVALLVLMEVYRRG